MRTAEGTCSKHEWRLVPPQRPSAETLWFFCIHCLEQVSRQRKRNPGG